MYSINPFLLDKSVLSGLGLEKIDLKDEPDKDFYQKRLYQGEDISIYVVSTETWNTDFKNFWFDEFVYMFHGEAIVKPEKSKVTINTILSVDWLEFWNLIGFNY